MALSEQIKTDLKEAMKARQESCVTCLRMLVTAIKNMGVEKG